MNTINTTTAFSLLDEPLVDMKEITELTGLTDKWFYKQIQEGRFPKPIKFGPVPVGRKVK